MVKKYIDKNGEIVFADSGLGGDTFGSFRRSKSGGKHRIKSPVMPMVDSLEVAQKNLDTWAEKQGLKLAEEGLQ